MFFSRKKKNQISFSRHRRLEEYRSTPKRSFSFVFKRPISSASNLPKEYANALFGRPFKKIRISYLRIFIFLLIVVAIAYFAIFSSFFKVKTITVVNNSVLLEEDIVSFLKDRNIESKNIFLVDGGQIRTELMEYYKRIEDARVYKVLPSKIKIKVQEKPSTVIWVTGDKKYMLDDNGYVLGTPQEEVAMPTVTDLAGLPVQEGDRIVTRAFIDFVNTVDESLKKRFGLNIAGFSINQTTFELRANTATGNMVTPKDEEGNDLPAVPEMGYYLVFDTLQDPAEQLDKLTKLLANGENIREYVILSIEGKVIVK